MTERTTDHAGRLIAYNVDNHQHVSEAASYIRTLEGLVRDAVDSASTYRARMGSLAALVHNKKWMSKARALGLTEDK